ncbi:MAG: hypothetical protein HYY86_01890 [Candidatus Harrisonbacteria bacterium]|nr:hypothetical protein [Candidatus Harrisonbacteria bacterium]
MHAQIKKNNYQIILLLFFLVFLLFLPIFTNAQQAGPSLDGSGGTRIEGPGGTAKSGGSGIQPIRLPNPLQANTFQELIGRVVNFLLAIGAPILVLMIIIGAFQIMTGAGNPENITKGRQTITYAIIGYALLLLSKGITLIIEQLLGVNK